MPYTRGTVFSRISRMDCDVIVGLDFGFGETAMYKFCKNAQGSWEFSSLRCGPDQEIKLPSWLCYGDDKKTVIGSDAADDRSFFPKFKVDPGHWSIEADIFLHITFRKVIRDFIGELWSNAVRYDDTIRAIVSGESSNRLMIAAGCPSSPLWLAPDSQDAYRQLIREATGCAQVELFPESVAAVMTLILEGKGSADAGIAVYDLGARTTDFTYLCIGKKMIFRSFPIGGTEIDSAMLRRVLAENGISEASLTVEEVYYGCARLREAKEKYYRTLRPTGRKTVWLRENLPLNYSIDADFMKEVLKEDRSIQINDEDYQGHSWLECFAMFVERTRLLIADSPCEKVLLIGGTSQINGVKTVCEGAYGIDEAERGEKPSLSVAKGLCYAAKAAVDSVPVIEKLQHSLRPVFERQYEELSLKLSEGAIRLGLQVLTAHLRQKAAKHEDIVSGDRKELFSVFSSFVEGEAGKQTEALYLDCLLQKLRESSGAVVEAVNQSAPELYRAGSRQPPDLPHLYTEEERSVLGSLGRNLTEEEKKIASLLSFTLVNISTWYLFDSLLINYGSSFLFRTLKISSWKLPSIVQKLSSLDFSCLRHELVQDARRRLCEGLSMHDDSRNLFLGLCSELLELAVGKLLFLVYEEDPLLRPETGLPL